MKQIIEEVIRAEEKVSAILREARDKASQTGRSADTEITKKTGEAKQKAREIIKAAVEEAIKDAEGIREERLEEVDRQKDSLLSDNAEIIDGLVGDICTIILTTEYEKDGR